MWIKLLVDRTDRPRGSIFQVGDEEAHRLIARDHAEAASAPPPESTSIEPGGAAVRPAARKRRKTHEAR